MVEWNKCSEKMPDHLNSLKNECLIVTKNNDYMIAYWSVQLEMWRRISVPYKFNIKKVIDEIIPINDVVAWVYMDDIKMKK